MRHQGHLPDHGEAMALLQARTCLVACVTLSDRNKVCGHFWSRLARIARVTCGGFPGGASTEPRLLADTKNSSLELE